MYVYTKNYKSERNDQWFNLWLPEDKVSVKSTWDT